MFATERRRRILEYVRTHGEAALRDLLTVAEASEVTVRRDLRALEERGLVVRKRGGATVPEEGGDRLASSDRADLTPERRAIAGAAAALVRDGYTVAIGAGPVSALLATALLDIPGLTVVTNSLLVGEALARGSAVSVVMTGGSLRGATYGFVGSGAEQSLAELKVRLAFLSADGLTDTWGVSRSEVAEVGIDRAISDAAAEVVALVEPVAVGRDASFQTVPASRIGHVVTAGSADAGTLTRLRDLGVQVQVAPSPAPADDR